MLSKVSQEWRVTEAACPLGSLIGGDDDSAWCREALNQPQTDGLPLEEQPAARSEHDGKDQQYEFVNQLPANQRPDQPRCPGWQNFDRPVA
jgi:hypothetical protein